MTVAVRAFLRRCLRGREKMNPSPWPPTTTSLPVGWIADIRDWCRGRSALGRLPVLIYFAYVGYRQYQEPVEYNSWFGAINLCIHEGGHLLMRPFGNEFLHVAGGTGLQLAAPVICMLVLLKQGDYFGIPFCLGWLSTNLVGVGVYMADARARELPLVTAEGAGSGDAIATHDWAYLFGNFGLLDYDTTIGFATRALGSVAMVLALLIGAWMLGMMLQPAEKYVSPENLRREAKKRRSAI
jgi:hypothetical protein